MDITNRILAFCGGWALFSIVKGILMYTNKDHDDLKYGVEIGCVLSSIAVALFVVMTR